ncbi:MAG: HAMP domain-containing histidine kinase, partial [Chitinophagaceae bacterium]
ISFGLFVLVTVFFGFIAYRKIRANAKKMINDGALQVKLSDELAFQNHQLNDFANITSHNLRSSAANMTSLIEIAEEKSTLEDYKMIFEMMKKVSGNLNDSLNELIEILHIKRNTSVEKETLHFEEIFTTVTETLQGEILKSEATVNADFSAARSVLFSKIYLESIVQNLIGNSLKYRSPERKPVVNVRTFRISGKIVLEVSDNGLGIDLTRYGHKIFGMHQVFHKHPDAKGIGLFMTKAQIESLGGKIEVQSNGVDGTTFSVYFPE